MGSVSTVDRIVKIIVRDNRQDRPKLFLVDHPHTVGNATHNSWLDEISDIPESLSAGCNHRAMPAGIFDDTHHPVKLRRIADRPQIDLIVESVSHSFGTCFFSERSDHVLVKSRGNVHALY